MSKTALILGDSYSTFKGHIPDGYATWYPENSKCEPDVKQVTQTWWHQVMEEAGFDLVLNNSWSGSPIGYTGYNESDCSQTSSFIYRLRQLIQNGFFEQNQIDTVFVFGGTNDSCAGAPLGTLQYDNFKEEDLYFVLPAISYLLHLLRETLPNATIYCLINTHLKVEVSTALKEVSERLNIIPIAFEHIDKYWGHPTIQGMLDIKRGVLEAIHRT